MTLNEFKAFLEGMDVKQAPTPEQWKRLLEKLESVEHEVLPLAPAPVVPDPWRPRRDEWPWWNPPITCTSTIEGAGTCNG